MLKLTLNLNRTYQKAFRLEPSLTYLSHTVNRTPGVPQAMIDTEVWVPFDREEPVKSQTMVDAGSSGITGRWV